MNEARYKTGGTRSCASASNTGTVLMECVLVLPLLTLLIFAIVQFALIWYAQIMTHYAAYNAARAALVYHPGEYREVDEKGQVTDKFLKTSGVCWEAACRTLAWVSMSPDGGGSGFGIPGWWKQGDGYAPIPASSYVQNQVRVVDDLASSCELTNAPAVKVTLEFDFPLHVPVIGKMIAYFAHVEESHPSRWEVTGWQPSAKGVVALDAHNALTAMGIDYVTLTATSLMPKLWSSKRFARHPGYSQEVQKGGE